MKRKTVYIIYTLILFINFAQAQTDSLEIWRHNGYQAKLRNDIKTAIKYYQKILNAQSGDYDATLALARLYFKKAKYNKSIELYKRLLSKDPKDVEALKGLGDNYLYLDENRRAIDYYKKAISFLPSHIPLYFDLAKAYSWNDQAGKAIEIYQQILKKDNTYAEAFAGIGKMYYWQEKPYKAMKYYQKAMKWDPGEIEYKNKYDEIKRETLLNISSQSKLVNEQEENYNIDAFVEKIGISKRLTDHFDFSANAILDASDRTYYNIDKDTARIYNAAWIKSGYINQNHKIYLYGGYTFSDEQFSAYGINWKWNGRIANIRLKNNLTGGYDYFYYWNQVGQKFVNEQISAGYRQWTLGINAQTGIVDKAFILDIPNDKYYNDENPFTGYGFSLTYKIFANPKVNLSANYSFLDYTYKSNRYYSPLGRELYGPSANIFYKTGQFYIYTDVAYNFGSEYYYENIDSQINKNYIDADNWSINAETGYAYDRLDISISASRFYNNYYNNFILAFNLKYLIK
jgi:tetratricopeptide (TPR) repeat protein